LDFLRSTQKFAQSSSYFGHLLSKRPKYEDDFFHILCVSQKVRTLNITKCEIMGHENKNAAY
jgi:hypothetical protein